MALEVSGIGIFFWGKSKSTNESVSFSSKFEISKLSGIVALTTASVSIFGANSNLVEGSFLDRAWNALFALRSMEDPAQHEIHTSSFQSVQEVPFSWGIITVIIIFLKITVVTNTIDFSIKKQFFFNLIDKCIFKYTTNKPEKSICI